jgi:hypothetical protein
MIYVMGVESVFSYAKLLRAQSETKL